MRHVRFVGRTFAVRDPGPEALDLLEDLARRTSRGATDGRLLLRVRREYIPALKRLMGEPALDRPSAHVDEEGFWRLGMVTADDLVFGQVDAIVMARTGFGHTRTRVEADGLARVGEFCASLPEAIRNHPKLPPLAARSYWSALPVPTEAARQNGCPCTTATSSRASTAPRKPD